MRIALVDDETAQLQHLENLLVRELADSACHTAYRIDTYDNGQVFLEHWTSGSYDVIILDIFMEKITGVDIAKQIRISDPGVTIVFCSRSNDFASESYQVNALFYLLKPATSDSVASMLKRLNPNLIQRTQTIILPDGHTLIQRQILYTEYRNHVISIHLTTGEIYRLRTNHSELEKLLVPCGYICSPSKGILMNFHEISQLQSSSVLMSDGTTLPISRRKSKDVQAAYARFCFQKMRMEVEAE